MRNIIIIITCLFLTACGGGGSSSGSDSNSNISPIANEENKFQINAKSGKLRVLHQSNFTFVEKGQTRTFDAKPGATKVYIGGDLPRGTKVFFIACTGINVQFSSVRKGHCGENDFIKGGPAGFDLLVTL